MFPSITDVSWFCRLVSAFRAAVTSAWCWYCSISRWYFSSSSLLAGDGRVGGVPEARIAPLHGVEAGSRR
jgi:hypothetical protein